MPDLRVNYESLIRGKRLAPASKEPNPLTQKLYEHHNGPYVAHYNRVDLEWQVWWDGDNPCTFLSFGEDRDTALAVMNWLGDKWRETAGRKVYFIGSECRLGLPVKIGIAYEPRKRLSSLQTAHHEPLRILGTFQGGKVEEQRLHRKFHRFRLSGEWFRITPALKRIIDACSAPNGSWNIG